MAACRRRKRLRPSRSSSSPPAGRPASSARRGWAKASAKPDLIVFDMGGTTASASLVQSRRDRAGHGIRVPRRHQHAQPLHQGRRLYDERAHHRRGRGRQRRRIDRARWTPAACCMWGRFPPAPSRARPVMAAAATQPTVTDANVALGLLPEALAGGALALDRAGGARGDRARASPNRSASVSMLAASGIREVVNANMARAIRAVTVERGVDPRDFTLLGLRRQRAAPWLRSGAGARHSCACCFRACPACSPPWGC